MPGYNALLHGNTKKFMPHINARRRRLIWILAALRMAPQALTLVTLSATPNRRLTSFRLMTILQA